MLHSDVTSDVTVGGHSYLPFWSISALWREVGAHCVIRLAVLFCDKEGFYFTGKYVEAMLVYIRFSISCVLLLACGVYAAVSPLPATEKVSFVPLHPEETHVLASQLAIDHLMRFHYCPFKFDATFSSKVFANSLNQLDAHHCLLLKRDLEPFAAQSHQLAMEIASGHLKTAYKLYNLIQQRRLERYLYALSILERPSFIDGNYRQLLEKDHAQAPWPTTVRQREQLWYRQVQADAYDLQCDQKTIPQIKEILTKRYKTALRQLKQMRSDDAFFCIMNALMQQLDPHTYYLLPQHEEQFKSAINLSLEGIGVVLKSVGDYIIVHALVTGGPAMCSGAIALGDRIIGISQPGQKRVDVVGWRLDDVAALLKGAVGTKVCLEVVAAEGEGRSKHVTLQRARIRLEDQAIKQTITTVGRKKVALLKIPSFYFGISEEIKQTLQRINHQSIECLVIDLRGNGGGSLTEVVALSGFFVPAGPVVQIKDRQGQVIVSRHTQSSMLYKGTITLLVDHMSASASELFAAALQDYGRALVVGEQTFGKGTVQQHHTLSIPLDRSSKPLGHIQYTIQKFYRISGDSTQLKGVIPDVTLTCNTPSSKRGERLEENALPWDTISPTHYHPIYDLQPYLQILKHKHRQRMGKLKASSAMYAAPEKCRKLTNMRESISSRGKQEKKGLGRTTAQCSGYGEECTPLQRAGNRLCTKDLYFPTEQGRDRYLDEAIAMTLDLAQLQKTPLPRKQEAR